MSDERDPLAWVQYAEEDYAIAQDVRRLAHKFLGIK
jgi:hypothetical protein